MRKLAKRRIGEASIEAYACTCGSICSSSCGCVCAVILFNKESLKSSTSQNALNSDMQSEASANNYRK